MRFMDWFRRGKARSHPFGDGTACDGCDSADVFTLHRNGGWYCRRCSEEVASAFRIERA
jgi:hypothetical protein